MLKVKRLRERRRKITGAPKTVLVNDFISAIAKKNLENGIMTVRKATTENLDMKLYSKLIIEKFRMAVIFKICTEIRKRNGGGFR